MSPTKAVLPLIILISPLVSSKIDPYLFGNHTSPVSGLTAEDAIGLRKKFLGAGNSWERLLVLTLELQTAV